MSVQPIWNRLQAVKELTFTAQSQAEMNTGWNGTGTGQVVVEMTGPLELLFHEQGSFVLPSGRTSRFHNTYRWTASDDGQFICLEHLRFGAESPVYLFAMAPQSDGTFHSVEPHVCRDDCCAAKMSFDDEFIRLTWTVSGPAKAEMISYVYR